MKQIHTVRSHTVPGVSNYSALIGQVHTARGEPGSRCPWMVAGTFRRLRVVFDTAPGTGTSWALTVYKNGVATSLTVTISDTDTTATDTSNSFTVAAGDYLTLRWVATNTPASAGGVRLSIEFEGDNANESGYSGPLGLLHNTDARYTGVFWTNLEGSSSDRWVSAFVNSVANVVPTEGSITGLTFRINGTPGGGAKQYEVAIYLNGVKQDGSGGTVDTRTTIADVASTATSTFTLPVATGDRVYIQCTPSNTPTGVDGGIAVRFAATTDGESILGGWANTSIDTTVTTYSPATLVGAATTGAESTRTCIGNVQTMRLSRFHVALESSPGASNTLTWDMRVNSASPSSPPTVVLADADVIGSDLVNTLTVIDGDTFNIRAVPVSLPTSTRATWSMVQTISAAAIRGSFVGGENTTVNTSRAVAWGLDGATNVHSEEGVHKTFGHVSVTGYLELSEMASPPTGVANKVRIYAEDDGAGKTRLMALFGSGSAQQLEIEP